MILPELEKSEKYWLFVLQKLSWKKYQIICYFVGGCHFSGTVNIEANMSKCKRKLLTAECTKLF